METRGGVHYHIIQLADEISGIGIDEAKSVVGDRIKRGRKAAGLTAKELGEKLKPPVSQSGISSWERGRTTPTAEMRDQLESILGAHLEAIDEKGQRVVSFVVEYDASPKRKEAEDKLLGAMKELSVEGIDRLTEYAEFLAQKYPAIEIIQEEQGRNQQ